MGIVDYFRLPKRMWYWYRNEYRHIPPPEWPQKGTPAALKLSADKTVLRSVNGTDDSQIIVTVLGKNGKPVSNCPVVTLAVESGPGQFPTGPSITFAPSSDIAIRDGMAAIEFRSYYAGKTIIRATSPGLKDATIEIVSHGSPNYVSGQTPVVQPRPYVRFTGKGAIGSPVTLGTENPTRTSSETTGHSGRMANDGNAATFWQAAAGDSNAWLCVDLERIVTIRKAMLKFPSKGNWRYKIEVSDDGESGWKQLVDRTQTTNTAKERTDTVESNAVSGRFLRVSITGTPAKVSPALSEVEVNGMLVAK
jgi:hypothetical protein